MYRVQCKDFSRYYAGQISRKLAKKIKDHRPVIRNYNVKEPLMVSHCVDIGHILNFAET